MQNCASRKRLSTKALIEDETMDGKGWMKQDDRAENGCSIVEINNATDDPLSPCPKGTKLEKQFRVHTRMYVLSFCLEQKSCTALTMAFVLLIDLIS